MERSVDVLIVGGGLVGMSLACALVPSRLDVAVLEAHGAPAPKAPQAPNREGSHLHSGFEPRVSAINPASKDFIDRIGAWPGQRVCPFTEMLVWDARGTARIEFDAAMIGEQALGYIVENSNLLVELGRAAAAGGVDTTFDAEVDSIERGEDGYSVLLAGGDRIACRLLVGADGGNSIVRKARNIRAVRWNYGQDAVVTTVMTDRSHGTMARQCFTPMGPLAFLPLDSADQRLCSIVWSTDRTEELLTLTDEGLCRRLGDAFEGEAGEVIAVDRRYSFPLVQQHALAYVQPHLALIGDAAHVIHPLAGQGVNLGFADAQALSVALGECRLSGRSPGDMGLLRGYQRSRRAFNMMMTSAMEGFRRLYGPDHPALNWARNTGMRFVNDSRVMKATMMRLACGR